MFDFWSRLLDTADFPARWHCGHWTPGHGWLHVLSDLGVWSAYVAIPCVLGYFVLRRRDIPFRPVFWLFAVFILACGTTHLLEAAIFWWPAYRLAGLVKFITAVVSWGTIFALARIAPRALALRGPEGLEHEVAERTAALEHSNESLRGEIAERMRAAESLRGSEQRFARFMQHLPGLAWIKDSQGRYEYVNHAAEKVFRTPRARLYGKTDTEVFPKETAAQFQENDRKVLVSGTGIQTVETLEHEDGSLHYSLVSKFCIPGPDGKAALVGGMAIDITDQKLAEDELRRAREELEGRVRQRTAELAAANAGLVRENEERRRAEAEMSNSEQRYRSLVEATTAMVWNTPASGEFETEQAGWSRFTGQSFEELKGWGWLNAVHPDDRPHTASVWSASVAGRSLYQVEHRLRRYDGEYRHMLVRAVPILAEDGTIREWIGVHTDVDTQKRAEVALREAKETAEAANRSKSEFLANMSHEIRTPMNGILGVTELMLDMEISARQREYLGMVKSSADSLLAVINDLLDFSKIEAGKLELDPITFKLSESVDDTLKLLALRAHKKGLELACRIEPGLPATLVGDAGRLRQVLINLVGNAVKFTERGEVVVDVRTEGPEDDGVRLHFAVRDTGIGIPAAKQRSIFDPFTQADGSVTRTYGGTGLGLPISSKLVELMGGRLWLESEPGKGSTFHFSARFGQAADSEASPPSSRLMDLENVRVLVVDDNATNRLILEEMLLGWRMKPSVVEAGPAALSELELAAACGQPYALVLLDALMPEMDGFAVAEQIRRHPSLAGATILMLSSVDLPRRSDRCRELGLAGYIVKPIRQTELREAVCTALALPAKEQVRPGLSREGPDEALPAAGLRLLVAEDNAVNQAVARRMLEKQGHQAEIVANGKEALAALERGSFDLVLMDIQMPEMGGFEATAAIRAAEQSTGRHVPIIALTAHAMKGDRERCLAAGMDGYLSKPIQKEELRRVLSSLTRNGASAEMTSAPQQTCPDVVLDWQATLERYHGDMEFARTIARLVLKDSPQALDEIRHAMARDDSAGVGRIAHKLSGAVSSFVAPKATAAARKLEALGTSGAVRDAAAAVATLEEELTRLNRALADMVASAPSRRAEARPGALDPEKSNACTP